MGARLNGIIFDDLECPLTRVSRSLFFSIYDENNEVIAENRLRTVASPGACERLNTILTSRISQNGSFWGQSY